MRYEEQNNQANHALNSNIQSRRMFGYGVISGGNVTINTGTLGSTENTLSLDATDVLVGGTEYNLSSQNVSIDSSDSDPRQDVIYVDSSGNVQVAKGTPAAAKTPVSNPDYVDYYEPVPVDLQAVDATVLFRVWVPANAGGVTSDELIDMRMDANVVADSGAFNSVSTTNETTIAKVERDSREVSFGDTSFNPVLDVGNDSSGEVLVARNDGGNNDPPIAALIKAYWSNGGQVNLTSVTEQVNDPDRGVDVNWSGETLEIAQRGVTLGRITVEVRATGTDYAWQI